MTPPMNGHSFVVVNQTADWSELECCYCAFKTSDINIDLANTLGQELPPCKRLENA